MESQINFSQMLLCKVEVWKWICHIYFYKMLIFIFNFPDTQSHVHGIQAREGKHWACIDNVFCCAILGHEGEVLFLFGSLLFHFKFWSSYLGNEKPTWSCNDSDGSFATVSANPGSPARNIGLFPATRKVWLCDIPHG